MDDTYLVEIRLVRTKWRIKQAVFSIGQSFGIGSCIERHPHVTLFGPLTLNPGTSRQMLLDVVGETASRFGTIPFTISAWEKKEGLHGSVIAFTVIPSDELRQLTREVAGRLSILSTSLNAWDSEPEKKWFHVTVANRLRCGQADEIFSRLSSKPAGELCRDKNQPGITDRVLFFLKTVLSRKKARLLRPEYIDETGLRVTVMNGEEIFAEYDLARKIWIDKTDLSSSRSWQETLGEFRRRAGFELCKTVGSEPGDIFVMGDTHFGHANIIRYCCRPFAFRDVREMDSVLIDNWNYTVPRENEIYFLGDLCYGRDAEPAGHYLDRLKGKMIFIRGNHDNSIPGTRASAILDYGSFHFLLVHDPSDVPTDFDGWVIHGHHHNNNLQKFPFINFAARRINVSAEVVGYSPVSLRELVARIREGLHQESGYVVHLRYPYIR